MYFRRKTSAGRAYLQIVEGRRDGDQVHQQVIATLGRFDELQASGQLERLVRSGARFAAKAMVLSAASNDAAIEIAVRRIGPALVFERLWEETGCRAVVTELAGKRKHGCRARLPAWPCGPTRRHVDQHQVHGQRPSQSPACAVSVLSVSSSSIWP